MLSLSIRSFRITPLPTSYSNLSPRTRDTKTPPSIPPSQKTSLIHSYVYYRVFYIDTMHSRPFNSDMCVYEEVSVWKCTRNGNRIGYKITRHHNSDNSQANVGCLFSPPFRPHDAVAVGTGRLWRLGPAILLSTGLSLKDRRS